MICVVYHPISNLRHHRNGSDTPKQDLLVQSLFLAGNPWYSINHLLTSVYKRKYSHERLHLGPTHIFVANHNPEFAETLLLFIPPNLHKLDANLP